MRELQPGLIDHLITDHQQIEIEGSRCARVQALTTSLAFDFQQQVEQLAGVERRVADEDRVQVVRLIGRIGHSLGLGFDQVGQGER